MTAQSKLLVFVTAFGTAIAAAAQGAEPPALRSRNPGSQSRNHALGQCNASGDTAFR
jgi:hypothetical protein